MYIYKRIIYSSLFLLSFNIYGSSFSELEYVFSHESSTTSHHRYGGLLTMSLLNQTGHKLDQYRILMMVKKDLFLPFTPSNVIEQVWRISGEESEVVLPLMNLDFSLVVYRGHFDDKICDREVMESDSSNQVYFLQGEEVDPQTRSIRLKVNYESPRLIQSDL